MKYNESVFIWSVLFSAGLMVIGAVAYGIWCISSEKSEKQETKTTTKTLYTYYKKDFDDMWEMINSWCVKYCNKEFPRYHDEIFLGNSQIPLNYW